MQKRKTEPDNQAIDVENVKLNIGYGLRKIGKLQKEIELLNIEHEFLVDLGSKLNDYIKQNLPHENLELDEDDLYFKWSQQSTRYFATAKGIYDILVERQREIRGVMLATVRDMKSINMTVPEDMEKSLSEELSQME